MSPAISSPKDVDIYPLYEFDQNKSLLNMPTAWMFRVNARLDPEMLRSSLSRLLQIGDWRKLAGRFKRNVSLGWHSSTKSARYLQFPEQWQA